MKNHALGFFVLQCIGVLALIVLLAAVVYPFFARDMLHARAAEAANGNLSALSETDCKIILADADLSQRYGKVAEKRLFQKYLAEEKTVLVLHYDDGSFCEIVVKVPEGKKISGVTLPPEKKSK